MDIVFKDVTHIYHKGTPFEQRAIENTNLSIASGSFVSVIGHTGSGKSTLIQHFNGLLKPTTGTITMGDMELSGKSDKKALRRLRQYVGLVFQYPEHQLFEETVLRDICFGPLNFGATEEEAEQKAYHAMDLVGLPKDLAERSPFDLSGGQMRRVAIAGVIAMEPKVMILDEPTAGLDPKGQRDILSLFQHLHAERGLTTVMVTHHMADAAIYSDEIIVMDQGQMVMQDSPDKIFAQVERLKGLGLDIPETMAFLARWRQKLGRDDYPAVFTVDDTSDALMNDLYGSRRGGVGR
ncbi:energy-coupling factor transporter ATPase [Tuberibacillus sp. Marseille-P3662]|uniref:energy-coupling factor transporter ATPase n=1 Tax=Tuberibacillus sp. Marseille-P3662 TaxID=1965358 RepID=UPI000A1CF155|nr:energy-coupling factor transporter ATPase [Tuberibacillus sp. Marseille-P3662]